MTAAVPDPREDIDWTKHRGSCRVFYAERRCTCGAVPGPRFRDQLAEDNPLLTEALRYYAERRAMDNPKGWAHVLRVLDHAIDAGAFVVRGTPVSEAQVDEARIVLTHLAEVEARVQAAANQRAAEVLLAAAQWLNADPDEGGAPYITNDHTVLFPDKLEIAQVVSWACASLRDRAAALASPAPTSHVTADGEAGQ